MPFLVGLLLINSNITIMMFNLYTKDFKPRMDLGFQARGALLYAKKIPNKHPYQGFEFYFGYCFRLATETKYYGTHVCFALFQNYE